MRGPICLAQTIDVHGDGNFPQGCSFSPDGLCIATATAADARLRLYNTVHNSNCTTDATTDNNGKTSVKIHAWQTALASTVVGETIRSYDWYPPMNSSDPSTCCLIATGRDQPVQLIDAYTGGIRATYVPMNAMDEMESPSVVQFSTDGHSIVAAGFRTERMIQLFDSARPGKHASSLLKLGQTRRSSDGQKGLVSALAFHSQPQQQSNTNLLAVGTYAPGSIYIYDFRQGSQQPSGTIWNGSCIVGHGKKHASKKRRNGEDDDDNFFSAAKTQWYAHRAQRGITQLQFDQDGKLYSASRNSDSILVWDVRMLSGNPSYSNTPIRGYTSFPVSAPTNQRIQFALDDSSSRLFVGGVPDTFTKKAVVRVYNTSVESSSDNKLVQELVIPECAPTDAVNGLSYNATYDMLAVATGSRRFPDFEDASNDNQQEQDEVLPPGSLRLYKWNTVSTTKDSSTDGNTDGSP
ncbi:Cajal body protein 1 [Seminavis robusta]|uniref:Cajal body protein 1 n=1 Tax=Seminavis robusta TaxID=568900 RepID=A0A9N8DK68_9STRA|nr:Cajal body protein 1 [Seminavis robusta]|eukprot:Sro103_g052480.1 Cajal body protein 1 (464) ;mRNA; f:48590-49981